MMYAIGASFMAIGLLGYTGLWRAWSRNGYYYYVFGFFWFGLGAFLIGFIKFIPDAPTLILGTPIVLIVAGGASTWYLPPILTPRWFRAMQRSHG